jgi:hypothetical protein
MSAKICILSSVKALFLAISTTNARDDDLDNEEMKVPENDAQSKKTLVRQAPDHL